MTEPAMMARRANMDLPEFDLSVDINFSYISVTHNVIKILFVGWGKTLTFKST